MKQVKYNHTTRSQKHSFIDKKAISHNGAYGVYKCSFCGKEFVRLMSYYKRSTNNRYCSTQCKKNSQFTSRPKIDNRLFNKYYKKYYKLVRSSAFEVIDNGKSTDVLEDLMQIGFIEIWKAYNRKKDFEKLPALYMRKVFKTRMKIYLYYWARRESIYDNYQEIDENKISKYEYDLDNRLDYQNVLDNVLDSFDINNTSKGNALLFYQVLSGDSTKIIADKFNIDLRKATANISANKKYIRKTLLKEYQEYNYLC